MCAIISYRLAENFSVEGCGRWLESSEVRNELGIRSEVSHRAINRAVERCGEIMPEVLSHLRKALFSMYDLEHTDVNSHYHIRGSVCQRNGVVRFRILA